MCEETYKYSAGIIGVATQFISLSGAMQPANVAYLKPQDSPLFPLQNRLLNIHHHIGAKVFGIVHIYP